MTPTEILHRIVETENNARNIYKEAVSLREDFNDGVNARIEELRKQCFAEADEKIKQAELEAVRSADAEIERLDKKLESDLASAKQQYENLQDVFIDKIFRLAVNMDA
ncbi:MAG: hypothetical protein ACI3UZ_00445 [Oscillospiraceae bacterium]|nr:hypothetical protein [Oscillospiraceae bacterium]